MSKYCHGISKYGLVGLVSQNNEKLSQNNDFAHPNNGILNKTIIWEYKVIILRKKHYFVENTPIF